VPGALIIENIGGTREGENVGDSVEKPGLAEIEILLVEQMLSWRYR
jgi:hypothetical protein